MKLEIYASKDSMVGNFMTPFYAHNENEAKRNWGASIYFETKKEEFDPCLKDLLLFRLGEFNDETGEIISKVEYIANSAQYLYTGEKVCTTQKVTDQEE